MNQRNRVLLVIGILVIIIGLVLGVDYLQRRRAAMQTPEDMPPGAIPIFVDGEYSASFVPEDLEKIVSGSFVDAEEGKTQEGWLLRDVLTLYVGEGDLKADTQVIVSSSSREKSQSLTWPEIEDPLYIVLFDLSSRGTLKLASNIPGFDTRDAWVQDVDRIEVITP